MTHLGMARAGGKTLGIALAIAALSGACGSIAQDNANSNGGGGGSGGSAPFDPASSGLPCDVADVVGQNCVICHGNPPAKGVPLSLTTYEAFKQPAPADPTITVAEMALKRMQDPKLPMPPTGMLDPSLIQAFADWVGAGLPAGDCGGAGGAGGQLNVPTDPLPCTGQQWPPTSNHESPLMHPGVACIDCHDKHFNAPVLTIAGTIYGDAYIDNDCYGTAGAQIEVTDANGAVYTMTSNPAGNFYRQGPVYFPISAKVTFNGKEIAMKQTVTTGDCNSCHTWNGAQNAPGRILLP
jgi:hypothetical protein